MSSIIRQSDYYYFSQPVGYVDSTFTNNNVVVVDEDNERIYTFNQLSIHVFDYAFNLIASYTDILEANCFRATVGAGCLWHQSGNTVVVRALSDLNIVTAQITGLGAIQGITFLNNHVYTVNAANFNNNSIMKINADDYSVVTLSHPSALNHHKWQLLAVKEDGTLLYLNGSGIRKVKEVDNTLVLVRYKAFSIALHAHIYQHNSYRIAGTDTVVFPCQGTYEFRSFCLNAITFKNLSIVPRMGFSSQPAVFLAYSGKLYARIFNNSVKVGIVEVRNANTGKTVTHHNPALDYDNSVIVNTTKVVMDVAFDYDNEMEYYLCRDAATNQLRIEKRDMATHTLIESEDIPLYGNANSKIFFYKGLLYVGAINNLYRLNNYNIVYTISLGAAYLLTSIKSFEEDKLIVCSQTGDPIYVIDLNTLTRGVFSNVSYPDIELYHNYYAVTRGVTNSSVRLLNRDNLAIEKEYPSYSESGIGRCVCRFKNDLIALSHTGRSFFMKNGAGSAFNALSNHRWARWNEQTQQLYSFQSANAESIRIVSEVVNSVKTGILDY